MLTILRHTKKLREIQNQRQEAMEEWGNAVFSVFKDAWFSRNDADQRTKNKEM